MQVFTYFTHLRFLCWLAIAAACPSFSLSATTQTQLLFPDDSNDASLKTPGHKGIGPIEDSSSTPRSDRNTLFTKIQPDPTKGKIFIYFPIDGHQPTTERAAHWSQANTDNDPNSPITKWYMRMFGWTDPNNTDDVALHMGFIGDFHNAIIEVSSNIEGVSKEAAAENFWGIFRSVATDPVGRVLLYRLLIEIRRDYRPDNKTFADRTQGLRKEVLSMGVFQDSKFFLDSKGVEESFRILFSMDQKNIPVLKYNDGLSVQEEERDLSIGLFHEMLHWLHLLRDPSRYSKETRSDTDNKGESLAEIYFGSSRTREHIVNSWADQRGFIDEEEIRTILGVLDAKHFFIKRLLCNTFGKDLSQHVAKYNFVEGDDLSENVYRLSWSYRASGMKPFQEFQEQNMRWGHTNSVSIEQNSTPTIQSIPRYIFAHFVAIHCFNIIYNKNDYWSYIASATLEPERDSNSGCLSF